MRRAELDGRLLSAAGFVRAGSVFGDIGTDHGYLPIYLLAEGRVDRAVLSDINKGPLDSARANVAEAGFADRVSLVLTDGAAELGGYGITDYAICGMGGELIADIIEAAPELRNPDVRLILQPMSRPEHLRGYLSSRGFSVIDERYSSSDGKYYLCLCAEYTGTPCEITEEERICGKELSHTEDRQEYTEYLRARLSSYRRAADGRMRGGEICPDELRLCDIIEARLRHLTENRNDGGKSE